VATSTLEIIDGGIQTTIQDYPGRFGLLARGFFPAGPMDHLSLRAGNVLVGNPEGETALEITLGKFRCRFGDDRAIALTGAEAKATLNGEPAAFGESLRVRAGDELRIGMAKGPGFRTYLAISGGLDVPDVLGSRATYTMGALGGLEGRALKAEDRIPLGGDGDGHAAAGRRLPPGTIPAYGSPWQIEAMRGPQADPDYLTAADVDFFFGKDWKVDANSNRTGLRLEHHRFDFARETGGIAGGHPSNILDDGYPVGGVNLNGDTPVILGPDGPTSGGFIVVATIVSAAMWKIGQVRPGSEAIRFREVTVEEATAQAADLAERLHPDNLQTV
jgi:urea carboxylase